MDSTRAYLESKGWRFKFNNGNGGYLHPETGKLYSEKKAVEEEGLLGALRTTRLVDRLRDHREVLRDILEAVSIPHEDGCPEDPDCECDLIKRINELLA